MARKAEGVMGVMMDNLNPLPFLAQAGFVLAQIDEMASDASSKIFYRVKNTNGDNAILMHMPKEDDDYSHKAHLALDCVPFCAISQWLKARHVSSPDVLAYDIAQGLVLLEDLGQKPYHCDHLPLAIDILCHLHQEAPPKTIHLNNHDYSLPLWSEALYLTELFLFIDWFCPFNDHPITPKARDEFIAFWHEHFELACLGAPQILLRDFHSPNFIFLPERPPLQRLGLVDYQDALLGSPIYDLVSCLQDARLTISPLLEEKGLARYISKSDLDERNCRATYALLGAQRALKIIGIFTRLAHNEGKKHYLNHIPRVKDYLNRNLAHPICEKLRLWFHQHMKGWL